MNLIIEEIPLFFVSKNIHPTLFFRYKKMAELLLDSAIRFWVFMSIVVITFFVGMLRHYISIITAGEKPVDKQQLADR
jgi:hypothetical protein